MCFDFLYNFLSEVFFIPRRIERNIVINVHGCVYISFWFMMMMLIYWEEAYVLRIKRNAETLVVSIKETGLKVNADRTKHMVMPGDQNA